MLHCWRTESDICTKYEVSFSTLPCRSFALNHQLKNVTLNHGPFGKCNLIWINLIELKEKYRNFSTDPRIPVTCFGLSLSSWELHSSIDLPRLDWFPANDLGRFVAQFNALLYPENFSDSLRELLAFFPTWATCSYPRSHQLPSILHLQLHIACK